MSERLIQVSTLTEIADAIRDKKGTVNPIPVSSYASEIATIETGGGQSDKPFNLVSYINGTLTEVDDVNGVIKKIGYAPSSIISFSGGNVSFAYQHNLEYVNAPECVTVRGQFIDCYNLTSINIPKAKDLTYTYMFRGCSKLVSINAPMAENIDVDYGFWGCSSLESIYFPKCKTFYASEDAFSGCDNLKVIDLPECENFGGSRLVYGSSVKNLSIVSLPKCMSILDYTFSASTTHRSAFQVYAPQKFLNYGYNPLFVRSANRLYYASINGISYYALISVNSSYMNIPYTSCKVLAAANQARNLGNVSYIYGQSIEWVCDNFASSSAKSLTRIELPICESVGKSAFANASKLSQLVMPMCEYVGDNAFYNSPLLTDISSIPLKHIGSSAFYVGTKISNINWSVVEYIGLNAFRGNSLSFIPSEMSNCSYCAGFIVCTSLTGVSNSVIKTACFSGCYNMTNASLPNCEDLLSYAFYRCSALTSVYLPKCRNIGSYAFNSCINITELDLPMCENADYGFASYMSSLVRVNAPKLKGISRYAFYRDTLLESVVVDDCEYVGYSAFYSCSLIKSINLNKCKVIEEHAFSGCSSLETISLNGLKAMVSGSQKGAVFYGCSALKSLDLPMLEDFELSIGQATALSVVSLYNVKAIPNQAFNGCSKLQSLYLHASYMIPMLYDAYGTFWPSPIYSPRDGVTGSIYVPASLYDEYRTATNWTQLKSRFVSM